ncbi:glucose PTS transporter subunit IIA [Companilactobacillus mishanensis]|uniref:glucose PTS transporter subunit IIA n=1 Tax=Companilactobacillus mishanensis TaxID=2486008 RepID=UPI000F77C7D8|nr:glucose PTS transporter subunit IIA [Companilactobacillus mishanensis]
MDYEKIADVIISAVGKNNFIAASHCATRIRLIVKNVSKINQTKLDDNPDIKGTVYIDGQYQIIIGPGHVDHVYSLLIAKTHLKEMTPDEIKKIKVDDKKSNPFVQFIKLMADIFIPVIPAIVAGGLLISLYTILTTPHLFGSASVVQNFPQIRGLVGLMQLLGMTPYVFLPALIGYTATKRFGGTPYLGALIGMAMIMPHIISGGGLNLALDAGRSTYAQIFGTPLKSINYQGQVFPAIVISWLLSIFEKYLKKYMPSSMNYIFTPLLTLFTMGTFAFVAVGPLITYLSNVILAGAVFLYNFSGFLGSAVLGALYPLLVITGLQQSLPAIETQILSNHSLGGDFIFPIVTVANLAQAGACLAVLFTSKNKKQRGVASSAGFSALMGITEPAIFGVNLKLRYPFYCGMIASGIAGIFIGIYDVVGQTLGVTGIIGFLSVSSGDYLPFIATSLLSIVLGFSITLVYGKSVALNKKKTFKEVATSMLGTETLTTPVSGNVINLTDTNDEVFSSELMGKGAAIEPTDDNVYAVADGTITVAYPTKHAYGLKTKNGAEVLVHLGINTVNLQGKYFTSNVKQGDEVKQGDLLGTFDLDQIKKEGYDPTVMVVITNTASYSNIEKTNEEVAKGNTILQLTTPEAGDPSLVSA